MDKATYRSLTTEERISYLNSEMAAGKTLAAVCKEIGIANNVTADFHKKGYIRNEEGLYVKHEPQHPGQITIEQLAGAIEPQENAGSNMSAIIPPGENEPTETPPVTTESEQKPKRVGRPARKGEKPKKLTIEISPDVYKALMFYKIDQGIYVNGFIQELIKTNVPSKYFEI